MHRRLLLLFVLVPLVAACAPGAPPPGPIDVVRKVFDPDYDYTESPSTWDDEEQREAYLRDRALEHDADPWAGSDVACGRGDLACSHEGVTICCASFDRCCAATDGPYCCDGYRADRDLDEDWLHD